MSFVDIGSEYTWGQRTVLNNQNAPMNVLTSTLAFRFWGGRCMSATDWTRAPRRC